MREFECEAIHLRLVPCVSCLLVSRVKASVLLHLKLVHYPEFRLKVRKSLVGPPGAVLTDDVSAAQHCSHMPSQILHRRMIPYRESCSWSRSICAFVLDDHDAIW